MTPKSPAPTAAPTVAPDAEARATDEASGGVQSIETGLRLLEALVQLGDAPMLKALAEHADMPPPKAHRYLTSFCRGGLVERDPSSGRYRLGPLALQLGLVALRRVDVVKVAAPALRELRDATGLTASLLVWGYHGPTYIRLEEARGATSVTARLGSVVPMLDSAAGRLFAAHLPAHQTRSLVEAELAGLAHAHDAQAHAALLAQVRERGIASNEVPGIARGIHALAAPVFDHTGAIAAALVLFAEAGMVDIRLGSPVAAQLKAKAAEVSRQMGYGQEQP